MPTPILATKLYIPRLRPHVVIRPHLIERLIPDSAGYCHDDPRISDCERGNARAHLRAVLLGRTLAVGVNDGDLTLGQFQSVIFAELDGPRKRAISIQVIGE